jgi:hypothetical protein
MERIARLSRFPLLDLRLASYFGSVDSKKAYLRPVELLVQKERYGNGIAVVDSDYFSVPYRKDENLRVLVRRVHQRLFQTAEHLKK